VQQLFAKEVHCWHTLKPLTTEEYNKLREQLRTWCKAGRGRQKKIAETLGVSKQLVSGWLSGHRIMSLDEWLQIQAFLKKQRRGK
jgi:DNA-binding transcriptional regulator YiaG